MPDSPNQNPWQSGQVPERQAAEAPKVAPPPVEIAIRTMTSDIASMGQSGGGPPRPESIVLPSLGEEERMESPAGTGEKAAPRKTSSVFGGPAFKYGGLAGLVLVAAAAVFFGSYYVSFPFIGRLKSPAPAAVSLSTSTPQSAQAGPSFEHHSFFKQAVDGIFPLNISSSSAGFKASGKQLGQFLAGLSASSTFFEIQPESPDNRPLSADQFFSSINGGVLEERFLASAFNPDITVFLYKDKNGLPAGPLRHSVSEASQAGLWPGYILQLRTNQTPLLLQSDIMKIESASSNWEDLFLQPPGTPAPAFRDALVSGQPVRVLDFSGTKSVLVYGWFFNKYLIISTSLDGVKQAIQHF